MNLDSRIRFGIQDLIDSYDREWKAEIVRSKQDNLLKAKAQEQKEKAKTEKVQGRSRKNSKVQEDGNLGFMQIQKKKEETNTSKAPATSGALPTTGSNSIYSLLSNLKPDQEGAAVGDNDSHSEDEDAMKLVDRKISLN